MNRVELTACVAELSPLRYTPAGIPALNVVLEHESEIVEAEVTRKVKLTVKAVAFGVLAEQSATLALGKAYRFTGFLVNARASKGVIFHIQALHAIAAVEQVLNPI